MTAKTMAEVLTEHWFSPADYAYCLCGVDMSPDKPIGVHEALAAHQAAALSAAGFGLVADAKAEALEEAAAAIETQRDKSNPDRKPEEGWSVIDHRAGRFLGKTVAARLLRNRATALRGDS